MKKYIVEFIGTFFLVFTVVCVVNGMPDNNFLAPVAIGAALMVMVYAGGHISGAHYNPAVTLGVLMRGKVASGDVPMYMIAQVLGAILAAVLGATVMGKGAIMGAEGGMPANTAGAFVAEMLGTFALVWVVLHTATTKSTAGNSYYGLAIGLTVTAMAYALGSYAGGFFNPAVAIGCAFNGLANWATAGLGLVADFIGAALAAVAFKAVYTSMDSTD